MYLLIYRAQEFVFTIDSINQGRLQAPRLTQARELDFFLMLLGKKDKKKV